MGVYTHIDPAEIDFLAPINIKNVAKVTAKG